MLKKRVKNNVFARGLAFLLLTAALTAGVWFFLADGFKAYRSEVSILLLPRDEKTVLQAGLILENLAEISKRLSFYDQVLADDAEIKDPVADKEKDARKKYWNANFEISRNGSSSLLTLAVFDLSEKDAQKLAKQSALTLIDAASRYYNVKTEADFRLLDEVETRLVIRNQAGLLALSFALGATLAILLSYIFSVIGEKIVAFIVKEKKRLMTLGIGWTFDQATNLAFDFLLYPLVIGLWGLKIGGGIMIVLSIVTSIAVIRFYDRTKKDWLGIEAVKSVRDGDQKTKLGRAISWLMKKGDPVALIGLSILYSEPVAITLYMRRGAYQYNGFSKRDWTIFLASVIISNVSWGIAVWGGLEAVKALFSLG